MSPFEAFDCWLQSLGLFARLGVAAACIALPFVLFYGSLAFAGWLDRKLWEQTK